MEKREFMEIMLGMSLALKKWAPDFTDQATLRAWYQMLGDIEPEKLRMACKKAILTLDEFPSIAKIIRMTKGSSLSDEEIGQDVAGRIEEALSRYGYTSPDQAQKFIGEIGWETVRQLGGWSHICSVTMNDMLPSSRKQWRELATVVSKKFHFDGQNVGPALPEGAKVERPKALQAAMDLIKIGGSKEPKLDEMDESALEALGWEQAQKKGEC